MVKRGGEKPRKPKGKKIRRALGRAARQGGVRRPQASRPAGVGAVPGPAGER